MSLWWLLPIAIIIVVVIAAAIVIAFVVDRRRSHEVATDRERLDVHPSGPTSTPRDQQHEPGRPDPQEPRDLS